MRYDHIQRSLETFCASLRDIKDDATVRSFATCDCKASVHADFLPVIGRQSKWVLCECGAKVRVEYRRPKTP